MSRRCAVCDHKARKQIDRLLIAGVSYRNISQLYTGFSKYSLSRHKREHIPELIAKAVKDREAAAVEEAKDLVGECNRYLREANDLLTACSRWLRDPLTGEIILDPRDTEIRVFYTDASSGTVVKRQALLADLIAKIESKEKTVMVTGWRYRHADPRDLLLKSIDRGAKVVELLGRLSGELQILPDVELIIKLVVEALQPHPEAVERVLAGLREAGAPGLN